MIDIYWWSRKRSENSEFENFGDILVPFLIRKITNKKFRRVDPNTNKLFNLIKKKHYFIIGSVIRLASTHTIVWGAGIIKEEVEVQKAKFLLVRGPLTRDRLTKLGYKVPERYGDPALLLKLFYKKENLNNELIGVIPHYVDFKEISSIYKDKNSFLLINPSNDNPEEVINAIRKCKYILSSSLHGLIVAHALDIPAIWMKVSDRLYGDDVKFRDYFYSVGIEKIFNICLSEYSPQYIEKIFTENYNQPPKEFLDKRLLDLIETCPFKKSKSFQNAIKNYFT